MTISSISANAARLSVQFFSPRGNAGADFAQRVTDVAKSDTAAATPHVPAAGANMPAADPAVDFTHMTPHQLYTTAQTMYDQGKIGLDELFNMQMMSGEFQTNGVSTGSGAPVDYVSAFKDTRAFNATHGGWGANGYDPYTGILIAIGAEVKRQPA